MGLLSFCLLTLLGTDFLMSPDCGCRPLRFIVLVPRGTFPPSLSPFSPAVLEKSQKGILIGSWGHMLMARQLQ